MHKRSLSSVVPTIDLPSMLFIRTVVAVLLVLANALSSSAGVPAPAESSGIPCGCFGDPITSFRVPAHREIKWIWRKCLES
ncbi:hypothetical protein B0H12DRAFT_1103358 [Mycena haematopus]|nr:hypothetical protein B0H12DRAFT_1103358 [Mycena haematopus]